MRPPGASREYLRGIADQLAAVEMEACGWPVDAPDLHLLGLFV
jgi:hypothetical protein